MQIEITIKNYRCFPDSNPARISLRDGFTSFVGSNNSGKSSLLKFFYEFRSIFLSWFPNSGAVLLALQGQSQAYAPVPTVFEWGEVLSNSNERDLQIDIILPDVNGASQNANCPMANRVVVTVARSANIWSARVYNSDQQLPNMTPGLSPSGVVMSANSAVTDLSAVFNAFKEMANVLYIGPFRNAVTHGTNDTYFDIQIGQSFITSWKQYKSGNVKKHNEACHKLTEDIRQIFGYKDLDITSSADDRSLQVLIDGKSFKLPEVGSGLTQFILVLGTAAIKSPSYIFIDEPELNLHPSLQLDFLTTLASYASNGIVFATHSIGLARAASDRIYSVRMLEQGVSDVRVLERTPRLAEFLGELSFSSYRELGFETVLLVEGRTEVKAIQQFLRLLKKDHQVVLIPLGGDTLINANSEAELGELARISDRICAVIDSERSSAGQPLSPNRQGFVEACNKVNINCKVLERRALENYLTDGAIKKAKGPSYQALGPYQERTTLAPIWAKTDNWRIAREMSLAELQVTDLGQFLQNM